MNFTDSPLQNIRNTDSVDRYIFRPRRRYTWAKGLLILMFLAGWGVAMFFYALQEQERPADASETKEKQLDWRQRPGTKYPTSYRYDDL